MSTALSNLPRHHLQRLASVGARLQRRIAAGRETGEKVAGMAIAAAESSGTAFALGAMTARYGSGGQLNVPGLNVPADLALAGAALAGSFFIGKHAEHLVNMGNGALAVYAARMGAMWGGGANAAKLFGGKPIGVSAFPAPVAVGAR